MNVGFVGLGNMGQALAENLVACGHDVVAHDVAGAHRCPAGAVFAASPEELARRAEIVVLSLPDGAVSRDVVGDLVDAPGSTVTHVVDTSTVGVESARSIDRFLRGHGVAYVDTPVSGGVGGARARTLAVMYAGSDAACAVVEPVLAGLSDRRQRVGEQPGMAQALKLLNNFLSATALAATSEAIAFGRSMGLDLPTMLEVLNASSGRSGATMDKFPQHVVTETYSSGFANSLMAKDLGLYVDAVISCGSPTVVAPVTLEIWRRFVDAEPNVDFTRIHPFIEGSNG